MNLNNNNKALDSDFNDILNRSLSDICDKDFNDNHILHKITSVSNNSATLTVGQTFAKWHDVEQYINAYAIKQGFATRLNYTEKNLGFLIRAEIIYHRAGTPINLKHNHSMDAAAVVFDPGHRVPVPTIVNMLTKKYSRYVHNKDIYNTLSHHSHDYIKELSQTAELLKGLNDNNKYMFTYSVNNNRFHCLFFTTYSAVVKFKQYSEILLIDAIYKTNRFGMPLLLISGIDAMGITFLIASELLTNKTIPNYCWIFQQLKQLISDTTFYSIQMLLTDRKHALISAVQTETPHIKHQLCIWHVEQNIIRNLNHKLKERFIPFIKDFKLQCSQYQQYCLHGTICQQCPELLKDISIIVSDFVYSLILEQYNKTTSYNTDTGYICCCDYSTQFSLPCHYVLSVHIVNKKVISVSYIGACWVVLLAKLDTDMSQSEENNFTEFTNSSFSTDFSNKHSNNFLTTINYDTHNMSVEQMPTRSTTELLKDIEAIADRVGHIKINNILASFVDQLNTEYPLL
ncbi:6956_t:CDS:2 [Cetraspora pellucida]|uniref:6956_t:CDS:1 n=1 Tax=Cetraspora pellucida TaxID=1433469 RepID=A0ACA9KRB0_9GLOM|nr:6956_t:CDS:2 [Cetraspora pellucida]